jgi:hypothetical protein
VLGHARPAAGHVIGGGGNKVSHLELLSDKLRLNYAYDTGPVLEE